MAGAIPVTELGLRICWTTFRYTIFHRRRIYTEEKAKFVAASWGKKLCQFLATLAILHQDELKNRVQISLFFTSSWSK